MDILSQAVDLLGRLSAKLFTNNDDAWFHSGVGRHVRHIIDFYTAFLEGLPGGAIDYDARRRNPALESSRKAAAARLVEIMAALARIENTDRVVQSKTDGHRRNPAAAFSSSTVGRELQFLAFHTVHHYAMVAMTLERQGFQTPETFGIAPSTLAYWQSSG
jgi:uncharacterized damage-inducible protein DinB